MFKDILLVRLRQRFVAERHWLRIQVLLVDVCQVRVINWHELWFSTYEVRVVLRSKLTSFVCSRLRVEQSSSNQIALLCYLGVLAEVVGVYVREHVHIC